MKLARLNSEDDYQRALARLDRIFHAKPGTPEHQELEILVLLIEKYENDSVGELPLPHPVEAIKFRMEQMGLQPKQLSRLLGVKQDLSDVLTRKRPLDLKLIRKLSKELNIPAEILIQPYETTSAKSA